MNESRTQTGAVDWDTTWVVTAGTRDEVISQIRHLAKLEEHHESLTKDPPKRKRVRFCRTGTINLQARCPDYCDAHKDDHEF